MRSKSVLSISLLLLMLLLAACGGGSSSTQSGGKASDDQQILTIPIGGRTELQSFDPALVTEQASIRAVNLVFTGLVQLNNKLEVVDQLAESHSVSADGLTWTFKLRPNLKFSDGTPLTSKDVAYSIDRALKPELKSAVSTVYLGLIKDSQKRFDGKIPTLIGHSILTPDDQTVVLQAEKKAAYFLQTLTYQTSFVVQRSMIEKYGDNFAEHLSEGIGGAGPFKVSKYVRGKQIEFVPNPNYYGKKPQLKKVVLVFYQKEDTAYRAYQSNQLHWALNVPSQQIEQAKKLPNNQFLNIPQLTVGYYTMNYLVKPFDNLKVRQAFDLAIDKDSIANSVYKGAVIPTNHIVPANMPGYNENLTGPQGVKTTKGDPALAKKLFEEGLKESNMTRADFPQITLTFASRGSADIRNEASAVQQMWSQVLGVNIKLDDVDYNKLLTERNRTVNNPDGMQMWQLTWGADYPDPQNWLTLLFGKGSPKNAMNYGQNNSPMAQEQQENQKLMEQADANQNEEQRMQQYHQAEQALVNDVVWIPVYQDADSMVRKPCVTGIVDNAQSFIPPEDWANIYITNAKPCADVSAYQ
uniref:Oligopeptide-binding protein OppA n=1 Tax=Thermosporothrix sp. COM3 TaxID=2490863 RepID=A0A455SDE1_9CHLR|nr:oligopeptide-binding protein OppA [Thermosporothrix sp. COM3]